jgi:hypothetical protein
LSGLLFSFPLTLLVLFGIISFLSVEFGAKTRLRGSEITFWSLWDGTQLAVVGALKYLDEDHVEIMSMKTAPGFLRKGVASKILTHII